MANETFTLTAAQIIEIYDAGRERGNDEAVSYYWGTFPRGVKLDQLRDAMVYELKLMDSDAWHEMFKEFA